ncbi:MAG: hypothetical protein ACREUW_11375 [Burkholderiales bacterium]
MLLSLVKSLRNGEKNAPVQAIWVPPKTLLQSWPALLRGFAGILLQRHE